MEYARGKFLGCRVWIQVAARDTMHQSGEGILARCLANPFQQDLAGDREHLVTGVLFAMLREDPGGLQEVMVRGDRVGEFGEAFALRRNRLEDRRAARAGGESARSARNWLTRTSAPGWSALLTTRISAISMMPAFNAWMSSPVPGLLTRMVVIAVPAISTSS